ncbi:MAG TPA: right-handed parallel beta-helix repeat-containing protein [Thermoanaerobaculia bacterium]|nr:right-handed parallel beta-helix repeat-containing protein [Thermoanaerobaculia bacterium]
MTRVPPVLFSLLLSFAALAQSPDLRISVSAPATVRLGDVLTLKATVVNAGDAPALNTRASLRIIPGLECDRTIALGTLAPGEQRALTCTQNVLDYGLYYLESRAGVGADNEPGFQTNNVAVAITERLTDGPDLRLFVDAFGTPKPGLPFPVRVYYYNLARTPAPNTTVTFTLSDGSFGPLPAGCTAAGNRATCALGTVAAAADPTALDELNLIVAPIAPDRSEAAWSIDVELQSDLADEKPENNFQHIELRNYKTFFVREATEAALRGALDAAGTECTGMPCLVAFRIPTAAKWQTIKLESQLDLLRGKNIEIDGTTQTGYIGDTNAEGPEIEIDGSATSGDGLRVPSRCGFTIRGLTLNGFTQSAVFVHDGPYACTDLERFTTVEKNYIGTDPTGTGAKPNERGVMSASQFGVRVLNNVISGNTRTAVYVDRGRALIANNIIGLNRTHDAPLPNGASGVYVSAQGSGTDVNDNYIGFNAHFGVAIDRGADLVALHGNSFQANGGLGIDWGLDGPATGGRVRAPVIRSATFANGVTTIEADASDGGTFPEVTFYASDSEEAEGQYVLGATRRPFRIVVPMDLRGKWITATLTEVNTLQILRANDNSGVLRTCTSEMSSPLRVE